MLKRFGVILLIGAILLAFILIQGGVFFLINKKDYSQQTRNEIKTSPTPTQAIIATGTPSQTPTNIVTPTKIITPTKTAAIIPTKPQQQTPFVVQPEINIGNATKKQMIFTFDGGAGTQSLQKILDTLQKHGVKGTFFVTGDWAKKNTDAIKLIAASGHEIFNHTYTHPYLTKTPDDQIISELKQTEDLLVQLTGKTTKPYFRPPYGDRNAHVLEIAGKQGYRSVYWTVDALDWKESEGYTAEQVKQRIYASEKNGSIVLMHIGDNITGQVLDEVFIKIKKDGYQIVSLTQGLK